MLADEAGEEIPDAPAETLEQLRDALGGSGNVVTAVPAAKTRLLVTLRDKGKINPGLVGAMGFAVFQPKAGGEVHVLVGLHPERFRALACAIL